MRENRSPGSVRGAPGDRRSYLDDRAFWRTIWQGKYHPQIIYSDKVCSQKLDYMHNNPLRKGFVEKPEDWLYSSARNYAHGDHSILDIELLQML